jgi:hypothetical protein
MGCAPLWPIYGLDPTSPARIDGPDSTFSGGVRDGRLNLAPAAHRGPARGSVPSCLCPHDPGCGNERRRFLSPDKMSGRAKGSPWIAWHRNDRLRGSRQPDNETFSTDRRGRNLSCRADEADVVADDHSRSNRKAPWIGDIQLCEFNPALPHFA